MKQLFKNLTFLTVIATLLLSSFLAFMVVTAMVEEFFNLYKLYTSKPKEFSKNSFILSKTSSCTPVNSIQKTGVKVSLLTKKDPSPSMNPNNQLFVIMILQFSGR